MSSLVQSSDYQSTCNVSLKVSGSLVQQFHRSNTNTNTNTYVPKLIINLVMRIKHAHWSNNNSIHKLTIPFLNQKQIIQIYTLSEFVNDNSIVTHSLTMSLSGALLGPVLSLAERQDLVSDIVTSILSKIPSTETMVLSGNPNVVFEVEIIILQSWFCNVDDQNNETTMEEEKQDAGDQVHGENCVVCFDQLGLEKGVYLPCGHKLFHKLCIVEWLTTDDTCPLCRYMLLSRRF